MSSLGTFFTFTDTTTNRKIRIQAASIVAYGAHFIQDTGEKVTAIYLNDNELRVIFVEQSPEQIDQLLQKSFLAVHQEL